MKAAGGGRKEIEGGLVDCSGVVESRLVVASTGRNLGGCGGRGGGGEISDIFQQGF